MGRLVILANWTKNPGREPCHREGDHLQKKGKDDPDAKLDVKDVRDQISSHIAAKEFLARAIRHWI